MYLSPSRQRIRKIREVITCNRWSLVYMNSFFDYRYSIAPIYEVNRLGANVRPPVLLAPRGEFFDGALRLKLLKKKLFILLAKRCGAYKQITWHASNELEKNSIQNIMGKKAEIRVAENLSPPFLAGCEKFTSGYRGELSIIFVSRISRNKNLLYAIQTLRECSTFIRFTIVGPNEDENYWRECQDEIHKLPQNINVDYLGPMAHEEIGVLLRQQDLLFFPTAGENYGHIIAEAIRASCPVLISDQTPWRHLNEQGIGWDITLENQKSFRDIIDELAMEPNATRLMRKKKVRKFANAYFSNSELLDSNRKLFGEMILTD